uniref:Uncharacterized protein n=1 Tax=viral metagenome TaxID=1070528 RepID=A0A6C0BKJ3_9ZZZZ
MSKWEISMEDAIEATKPLPKYEGIWESFLSDADINWKTNLLKGDHTLYDWDLTNSRYLLQEAQDNFSASEKLIGVIKSQITMAEGKKLKKGEKDILPGLKEALGTAVIDRDSSSGSIILLKRNVAKYKAFQQIAIDKNRTLRNILEMWFSGKLGDEWMKKAVTWVSEEAARRMKNI